MLSASTIARVARLWPQIEPKLGDIPAWLPLGWIAVESAGVVGDSTTSAFAQGENGLFQLSPDESASIGFDHQRILEDVDYSIDAGIALIQKYGKNVASWGIPFGSNIYWMLVKFCHTLGVGGAKKLVDAYVGDNGGLPTEWSEISSYGADVGSIAGHSLAKWLPNVDAVYIGGQLIAGGLAIANPTIAAPLLLAISVGVAWLIRRRRKRK